MANHAKLLIRADTEEIPEHIRKYYFTIHEVVENLHVTRHWVSSNLWSLPDKVKIGSKWYFSPSTDYPILREKRGKYS